MPPEPVRASPMSGEIPRVAVRVAYDGTAFHGSQRQPGVRTVEGALLSALASVGAVTDPAAARFLTSSRTDRGVSAAGNVFAFDSRFPLGVLASAVNTFMEDAWVVAVAPAPAAFHPRSSPWRRYRYFASAASVGDVARFADALAAFGGTHDFSSFARRDANVSPVRALAAPSVSTLGTLVACDFGAPSFLRNQIRRMVSAAAVVGRGEAHVDDIRRALDDPKGHGRDFGLAAPEPLVLLEVRHDLEWRAERKATERAAAAMEARILRLEAARAVADAMLDETRRGARAERDAGGR